MSLRFRSCRPIGSMVLSACDHIPDADHLSEWSMCLWLSGKLVRLSSPDLQDMVEELESLVDMKDRKVKKVMGKIKETIDEALDEDEED